MPHRSDASREPHRVVAVCRPDIAFAA